MYPKDTVESIWALEEVWLQNYITFEGKKRRKTISSFPAGHNPSFPDLLWN
jgi:hypothetical protein